MIFAIAMDYTVFLLASAKEHYERSGDPREAMVGALAHSGRVIFAAGAVMVAVFFTFALSGPLPPKEMGIVLGVAVLLDAFLVRLVLLPVLLRLTGRAAWWSPALADPGAAERPLLARLTPPTLPPHHPERSTTMCRAVRCKTCGKTTWAGCGQHVSQVMAGVPAQGPVQRPAHAGREGGRRLQRRLPLDVLRPLTPDSGGRTPSPERSRDPSPAAPVPTLRWRRARSPGAPTESTHPVRRAGARRAARWAAAIAAARAAACP